MKFYSKIITILMLFAALWVPSIDAAQELTLILDWFPNVDHLPIYAARQQGLFAEEGLKNKNYQSLRYGRWAQNGGIGQCGHRRFL